VKATLLRDIVVNVMHVQVSEYSKRL